MAWSFWVVDTRSGDKQMQVFPASGSFRASLSSVGEGSHVFKLRDASTALPRATVRELFRSWARTLVVCWDDAPVYAGLITGGAWDRATGSLTVSHREIRGILSKRLGWRVSTYPTSSISPWSWDWTVSGKSLRGLMRAVVSRGTQSTPGDLWHLPVVLPADQAGSRSFTEWAFTFRTIEQMVTDIQDMDGGPDMYLRSRWSTGGRHEWVCEIGSPLISGGMVERVSPPPGSPVFGGGTALDASGQLTGVFGMGEGSEQDMKVGLAGPLAGSDVPNMDAKLAFKDAATQADVDALAWGELRLNREVVRQESMKILAGDFFPAGVGATVREWLDGDEFLDDGWFTGYVVGFSASVGSDVVALEVQ